MICKSAELVKYFTRKKAFFIDLFERNLTHDSEGVKKTLFFNLYFEVDTIKSAHCVEHNLLFLIMSYDTHSIVKESNHSPRQKSGRTILPATVFHLIKIKSSIKRIFLSFSFT